MKKTAPIIDRPLYTAQIKKYIDRNLIKILTGMRRVGKSYILKSIASDIRLRNPDANIITINLEDFTNAHITDSFKLYEEIHSKLESERKNYIFLDEIQEIKDFEKVIRSLNLDPINDIYITGSNSSMLSSEIASRLAGRSISFHIYPLSYSEFLEFHNYAESEDAFEAYIRYGGMPYLRNLPDRNTWNEYLEGICDAIIFRDVVSRHSIRNTEFLQRLLQFLGDNTGQIFSAKKISDFLKSQRMSIGVAGVQNYISYLEEAYVIKKGMRWDIEGKRFFEIGEKYFFEDTGIRNSLTGLRPNNMSGLVENIIFNHLRLNGYKVKIGTLPKGKEIDFIAEKSGETIYIQAALTVMDNETAEREYGNLIKIPDNYEKIVVTLNETFPNTHKGIKTLTLREFLKR